MIKLYNVLSFTNGIYTSSGTVKDITYVPDCEKKNDSTVDKFTLTTDKGTFECKILKRDKIHDKLNNFNYLICIITSTKEKCIVSLNSLDCRVAYLYLKYGIKN